MTRTRFNLAESCRSTDRKNKKLGLKICKRKCMCFGCGEMIYKGEEMMRTWYRGNVWYYNLNLCSFCIRRLSKSLSSKRLKQAKIKRTAEML